MPGRTSATVDVIVTVALMPEEGETVQSAIDSMVEDITSTVVSGEYGFVSNTRWKVHEEDDSADDAS